MEPCTFCGTWTQLEPEGLCLKCLGDSRKTEQIVREWKEMKAWVKKIEKDRDGIWIHYQKMSDDNDALGNEIANLESRLSIADERIDTLLTELETSENENLKLQEQLAAAREGLELIAKDEQPCMDCNKCCQRLIAEQTLEKMEEG